MSEGFGDDAVEAYGAAFAAADGYSGGHSFARPPIMASIATRRSPRTSFGAGISGDAGTGVATSSSHPGSGRRARQLPTVFLDGSAELIASAFISAPNTGAATTLTTISIQRLFSRAAFP
jgi:hypothetical protein